MTTPAAFNPLDAYRYGAFVQTAYLMFGNAPKSYTPPVTPDVQFSDDQGSSLRLGGGATRRRLAQKLDSDLRPPPNCVRGKNAPGGHVPPRANRFLSPALPEPQTLSVRASAAARGKPLIRAGPTTVRKGGRCKCGPVARSRSLLLPPSQGAPVRAAQPPTARTGPTNAPSPSGRIEMDQPPQAPGQFISDMGVNT